MGSHGHASHMSGSRIKYINPMVMNPSRAIAASLGLSRA
jgi:hypothetical protein